MVRKRNAAKEQESGKKKKKKWSWKKKTLIFGTPFFLLIAFVGVFFLYQMSRSYVEPEYDLPLAGLKSDLLPKPETGVPSDYTPEENAAIAEYVLKNTEHYQSTMDAQVTASVGFINYDQQVRNTKVVDGSKIFAQALSLSSMVKVGEQKYFDNGIYLLREASDVQGVDNCTWSDDISAMSEETYTNRYGRMPDGLSNYLITKDTIVKGEYLGEQDGLYVYQYELDPKESAALYWRQVKTLSGSDKTPLFHEVQLTLYLDKDWRPQKTEIHENYDVSMPVIGMATCDGKMVEVFHDYDVPEPIPDQALFQKYIDEEYDPDNLANFDDGTGGDTDIMGYISNIFETDENGIATLALDFTINDGVPQRAYVQVDTKNMAFQLKWDSLLVGYENERIYLKFGNVKYYLEQADLMDVLQKITSQIGIEMPSMEELMSEDTLNALMENIQMLESDGKMNIVVKMDGIEALVNMTSDMQFLGAHATVNLDGFQMKLSASQVPAQQIEGFDDSYQDIRPVLDFSEPIINLINARTYAFTFRVDMDGKNTLHQNVSVRVSRHNTELASCLIDANINGKWLHVRIVGDTTYLSYGDLKFMFQTRDIDEIIQEVSKVIPPDMLDLSTILPKAYLDLFTNLDLNAIANSIQSMEMSGDNLSLKMKVGDDLIHAQVGRVGGQLSGAHLSGATVLGSKLTLNAKMTAVSNYPGVLPVNPFGYTDLKGLVGFIGPVMDLVNASTYEFSVNLNLKGEIDLEQTALVKLVRGEDGVSAKVATELFDHILDIRLVDGVTYVQYGNIRLRLDTADLDEIIGAVKEVLPEQAKELDLSKVLPQSYLEVLDRDLFQWLDSIDSVKITDRLAALTLRIGDDKVTLSLSRDEKGITGAKIEGVTVFHSKADLSILMLGFSQEKAAIPVDDPQSYVDLKQLSAFIGPIKQLLDARSYELDLSANLEGKIDWAQDAKLKLVRTDSGVNLELSAQVYGIPVTVKYIGQTAYLECGNVKLKMDTTEIDEITEQLNEILPEDALDVDLSELLPKAYLDLWKNPEIPALIDCVKGLSLDGETLVLTLGVGDDTITVRVAKQGNAMQSVALDGLTVMDTKVAAQVRLTGVSQEVWEIAADDAEYSDIREVLAFIPDILELIDSNSFGFATDVQLEGPVPLSTTLHGKLVRIKKDQFALEVSAQLDGEALSLRFVDEVVYARYGNLRLMLDTRDIDEIMAELKEILPPEWMDVDFKEWIPPAYLELIENPDLPALIQNIQTFRAKDGKLTFGVRLADTMVTLDARRGQNGKKLEAALILENAKAVFGAVQTKAGVQGSSSAADGYQIRLYLDDYSKEKWKIIEPTGDYLDVKELLPFVKPVVNILHADTYAFDLELSLFDKNQNETICVPAHLILERTDDGINLRLTANVLDQELEVSLIDSTAYVSYAGLNVKMKTKDFKKISRQIEEWLPDGFRLEIGDILPKGYEKLLKNPSPLAILRTLHSIEMQDDILTVKLKIGSDTIQLRAATDGETLTFAEVGGVTIFGQTVYLTLRDLVLGNTPLDWEIDSDAYEEVSDLLDFVGPFLKLIDAKSWKFTVAIELDGETYLLDVQLKRGKNNQIDFAVITDNLGGVPLCIEHTGSVTYIHYANIELYLKDADIETLLKKLEEILPEGIDLSGILDLSDSFDLDSLDLVGMLGSLHDLSFAGNTFSLAFDLGDDTVQLKVVNGEKYPELISVRGLLDGSFGLELRDLVVNGEVSIAEPDLTDAVNVMDLIDCLEPTLNILRADDCTMDLTVMEEYNITIRKVGDKIYLNYQENPVIALVMDVNQTTVLTDLIQNIMDLVGVIEELKDDPAVQQGASDAADKVQEALKQEAEQLGQLDTDTLFEILQSLTLSMTGEHHLEISLTAGGSDIRITAGSVPQDSERATLLVMGDGKTYAELTVTQIKLPAGGDVSGRPNDDDYVALDELAKFIKPITKLLEAKAYEFDVAVDLDPEIEEQFHDFWNGKLHVQLSRDTPQTVSARVKATLFDGSGKAGKDLIVTYAGDTVALQFGNEVKVRLSASEESELIAEIKKIMDDGNGSAPEMDYSAFLPQSYIDLIERFTPQDGKPLNEKELVQEILRRVTLLTAKHGTITVGFAMDAENMQDIVHAAVSLNDKGTEFASISLRDLHLIRKDGAGSDAEYGTADLTVDVTRIHQTPLDLSITEEFADLDQLAGLIEPIYRLFQADAYDFDVTVAINPSRADDASQTDLTEMLQEIWPDQKMNVKLERGTEDAGKETIRAQVTAQLAGEPLTVTYADDVAYLSYGALKLKLDLAGLDEKDAADSLIQAIKEAVDNKLVQDGADSSVQDAAEQIPYDTFLPQTYVDFMQEMYPGLPKDMDALMELFGKEDGETDANDINIIEMIGSLLERFKGLHISENRAELEFSMDGQNILKACVGLDPDGLGVSLEGLELFGYHKAQQDDASGNTPIYYHDTTLSLKVNEVSGAIDVDTLQGDDTYFDLDTLAQFVQPVFDLLNAKAYAFTVDLDIGDAGTTLHIDKTADVKIVRRVDQDGNILQKETNGKKTDVVDAQVTVQNFFGGPLTLTYWNGDDGMTPQIYVEYGDRNQDGKALLQLYFSQERLRDLLDELPKFLYDEIGGKRSEVREVLEQIVPAVDPSLAGDAKDEAIQQRNNNILTLLNALDSLPRDQVSGTQIRSILQGYTVSEEQVALIQKLLTQEQHETTQQETDLSEEQIRNIVKQLLPDAYAKYLEKDGFSVKNILTLLQNLTVTPIREENGESVFEISLKVSDEDILTATITKTNGQAKDHLSLLKADGIKVLDSNMSLSASDMTAYDNPQELQDIIKASLTGYTDLFGGDNIVMNLLTDALKDHPLHINFTVKETDESQGSAAEIWHQADAYVNQERAYVSYRSDKGAQDLKAQVKYQTIEELLPSIVSLLQIDLEQYENLHLLTQSLGLHMDDAIPFDVLSGLFNGIFDSSGDVSFESDNDVLAQNKVRDAIQKISWTDNEIQIVLDNDVLYTHTPPAQQGANDLTIVITMKDNGHMDIQLHNVHGSDTKTLDLTVSMDPATQADIQNLTGYMDFSSINQLYADLVNTANLKEYWLKGTLNVNILGGVVKLAIPTELKVTLNSKNELHQLYAKLEVPYPDSAHTVLDIKSVALNDPSHAVPNSEWTEGGWIKTTYRKYRMFQYNEVFYNPLGKALSKDDPEANKLYFRRVYDVIKDKKRIGNLWSNEGSLGETYYEHAVLDMDTLKPTSPQYDKNDEQYLVKQIMKYVYYCADFKSNIRSQINQAILDPKTEGLQPAVIENILKSYALEGNTYKLDLNARNLIGNADFGDSLKLNLTRFADASNKMPVLKDIGFETTVVSVIKLAGNLQLQNYPGNAGGIIQKNDNGNLQESLSKLDSSTLGENQTSTLTFD